MNGGNGKLPVFYLKPGEMHIADRPGIVTTVLGSCVSITMYSPRLKTGAICHGMLPRWAEEGGDRGKFDERLKYVDYSIRYMVEAFRSFGIGPHEIEAKMFGGADMFAPGADDKRQISIGRQNIIVALEVMEREGVAVQKRNIGGTQGRKLHFYLHTGTVFLKSLNRRRVQTPSEFRRRRGDKIYSEGRPSETGEAWRRR
jgi:chemotaxis protein CheD